MSNNCHTNHRSAVDNCTNGQDVVPSPAIYHERQSRELCALHTLNNLFQDPNAFSRKQLDNICYQLSPNDFINPHKSFFGLGNYDVNLILAAVRTKNCEGIWFDKRKSPSEIAMDKVLGFILNIPIEYKLGFLKLPSYRKHWIGVKKIDDLYYNLDSKLERPEVIGGEAEVCQYLKEHLSCPDKQLLLIVAKCVDENRTWLKSVPASDH